jgi:predicted neuraminidase
MRRFLALLASTNLCFLTMAADPPAGAPPAGSAGLLLAEAIYEKAPFPECHASTIAETETGLVAAWFGGTHEKHKDVGIWVARREGERWTPPSEVANGIQYEGHRHPCWNPVLFQPAGGPLLLFYKVGPDPAHWWGMLTTSGDGGKTWSETRRLPEGIDGPVKNKPVALADGVLLCPSSTENNGWRVHFERTRDLGRTWERVGPIDDGGGAFAAIQPSLLVHDGGRLQALCRSRQDRIVETWSTDGGRSWSPLAATALPNPNSGIDGVTLRDGRHLLVYNHTTRGGTSPRSREMLNAAVSKDGKSWSAALILENQKGEHSYPAAIQTRDGLVHITYTYLRRTVKHVVLDPAKLELVPIQGPWPGLARPGGEERAEKSSGR